MYRQFIISIMLGSLNDFFMQYILCLLFRFFCGVICIYIGAHIDAMSLHGHHNKGNAKVNCILSTMRYVMFLHGRHNNGIWIYTKESVTHRVVQTWKHVMGQSRIITETPSSCDRTKSINRKLNQRTWFQNKITDKFTGTFFVITPQRSKPYLTPQSPF